MSSSPLTERFLSKNNVFGIYSFQSEYFDYVMFINTYLFEIKFMKKNVLYKMLRNVVFVP